MAEFLGTKLQFIEINENHWRQKVNANLATVSASKTITADYKVDSSPPTNASFDKNIIANITSMSANDGIFIMLPAVSEGRKLHIWRKDTTSTAVGGQASLLTNRHIWLVPYLTSTSGVTTRIYSNEIIGGWTAFGNTGSVGAGAAALTITSHGRSTGDLVAVPSEDAGNTTMEFFTVDAVPDANTITLDDNATNEVVSKTCYYATQANTPDLMHSTAARNAGLNVEIISDDTHWYAGLLDN